MPLDNTSDISGPLARSVEDVARMLEALAAPDPADPLTLTAPKNANRTSNFTRYLNADGLKVSMPLPALCCLPAQNGGLVSPCANQALSCWHTFNYKFHQVRTHSRLACPLKIIQY